jgi:hypothetical protein
MRNMRLRELRIAAHVAQPPGIISVAERRFVLKRLEERLLQKARA